jgi:hypothetical protein
VAMSPRYARIPGVNLLPAVLCNIPIRSRKTAKTTVARSMTSSRVQPPQPIAKRTAIENIKLRLPKPRPEPTLSTVTAEVSKPKTSQCVSVKANLLKKEIRHSIPTGKTLNVVPQKKALPSISKKKPASKPMPATVSRRPSNLTNASKRSLKDVIASIKDVTKVYVLELAGGFIYVGQSKNIERRILQHMNGRGAKFTRRHKPTGVRLARLGNIDGAGDSGERQEVLLQMRMHGMELVRGWKYVNNTLSVSDIADIKSNWIEMFNLCRICMEPGHMAAACRKKKIRSTFRRIT